MSKQVSLTSLALLLLGTLARGGTLNVSVEHLWAGEPLKFNTVSLKNQASNTLSVTRLAYLISDVTLHRANGEKVRLDGQFAYMNAIEARNTFTLTNVPSGEFTRVDFRIGLEPAINHSDPATWPGLHPLNPNVNGLHWSWQGGYVFLALEGLYAESSGKLGGYSFHLASDDQLMNINLPVALDLSAADSLTLAFNVDQIFSARYRIEIVEDETNSTHSRTNDMLATKIRENIERAFEVRSRVGQKGTRDIAEKSSTPEVLVASNATPYRLSISSFFPRPELPRDNPITEEGVDLGRRLFSDARLSRNSAQSCASCHQSNVAGADAGKRFSAGADRQPGTRNAMPLFNLAWKSSFFWDGRAASLREQVLMPIQNPIEMHESLTNVVAKLKTDTNYPSLFGRAFGSSEITGDRSARALEQFLLTKISYDSKFDRMLKGEAELNNEEKRGFELFHTEYDPRRGQSGADCFHCHGGPLFQSQTFANNGLDARFADAGRSAVTKDPSDEGKFAVPSLRNVALTGPYMHDGRFQTLEEVIDHYTTTVKRSSTLDPNLAKHPDGGVPLSPSDKKALVAFLKTLTDESLLAEQSTVVGMLPKH